VEALQDRGGPGPVAALDPGWQAALEYADAMFQAGHEVSDQLYRRLAAAWRPAEVVEITMVIGLTLYFNSFVDALRVEPTR